MPSQHNSRHHNDKRGKHKNIPNNERGDRYNPVSSQVSRAPDILYYGLGLLSLIFGITFVIVGAVFMDNCNLDKMIPVWLLIMGIIMIIGSVWFISLLRKMKKAPFNSIDPSQKGASVVLGLVFIAWFIAGNVLVLKGYKEEPDYGHKWFENGCDKSLFVLSFVAIITYDIFVGIFLLGLCCWGLSHFVVRE